VPAESPCTVAVALATNLGVAVAKIAAALPTGSVAMLAEVWRAVTDTGNQALLLVVQHRSARRDDRHPSGSCGSCVARRSATAVTSRVR
jgi:divalent metal cation (Fe/Co/Zn/Cd) transporter